MKQLVPPAQPQAGLPATLATSIADLPFGSQARVCTPEGRIDAFLAYAGYERSNCTAKYALRVLNNTPLTAQARVYCVRSDGSKVRAYPRDFEVAPYALRDDLIPVRVDVVGRYERALVEVTTAQSAFTVEAPAPQPSRQPWLRWAAVAAAPLALMGATQLCVPRILGIEAPAKAVAGSTIDVPLQVSGIGSVAYQFVTRDGVQLAAGLADRAAVLRLQVPPRGAGAPYALHVQVRNAFTSAVQTQTIGAVVPATPKPKPSGADPQISEVSVRPSAVQAGRKIMVQYATSAPGGTVWLLDTSGRTWASAPLSRSGASALRVPDAAAGRQMRVVVDAQSGKKHAQSAIGIAVLPHAVAAQPPAAPPVDSPKAAQPQIQLSSQVVSPGDTVTVRVSGMSGDVRVTLMDAGGTTLEQGETAADEGGVTVTAPAVSGVTTYYVVASFSAGTATQTVVHRLVVTPR